MRQNIIAFGLILIASSLTAPATASGQVAERLRSQEYYAVGLIYNEELSALEGRALYPICISLPADTSSKPLIRYLRRNGFPISDPTLCEPAMLPGGQHHPKDYPHGLRIFIGSPRRTSEGVINLRVEADDLTLRPGEHTATALRRGIYHLKRTGRSEWQLENYTKEFDSKDDTRSKGCEPPHAGLAWSR